MKVLSRYITLIFTLLLSYSAYSQSINELENRGDLLRRQYDFSGAKEAYTRAVEASEDSLYNIRLLEKITQCDNGYGMLQYATKPEVWQVITVPRNEFFLYYSHLADGAFKQRRDGSIIYMENDAERIIYSDEDENGICNLYTSVKIGENLWSAPVFLNESLVSDKDEVLPMLSNDGKKLYFSSQGLFGMGGFDLFVSEWDDEAGDWSTPENLGFPFSSPFDDFMFSPTQDGNFTIFASNRNCGADSISIYVTKFDSTPVKTAISSIEEAQKVARLDIVPEEKKIEEKNGRNIVTDSLSLRYIELYNNLQKNKETIKSLQKKQESTRSLYAKATSSSELKGYEADLLENETKLFSLQTKLGEISAELQKTEMECLVKGIVPDVTIIQETSEKDAVKEARPVYEFKKHKLAQFPASIVFEEPEEKIDYSFAIGSEAMIVEDNTLPNKLVYQIQILASSRKVTLKQLKGLSPVFEKKASSGKYIYTVGLFSKYNDALGNLNAVKKLGFTSAFIVAFDNGKTVSVKNARALEEKRASGEKYRVVFIQYSKGMPAAILSLLRSTTNKDLAKGTSDEYGTIYFVAPFDDKDEADKVVSTMIAGGAEGVIVEAIK